MSVSILEPSNNNLQIIDTAIVSDTMCALDTSGAVRVSNNNLQIIDTSNNNLQIIDTTNSNDTSSNILLFSVKYKKELVSQIEHLSRLEHMEVYKIIRNDTAHITENINGIFINFAILNNNTIIKIKNYVEYCGKKKGELIIKENKMKNNRDKIFGKEDKLFQNKFAEVEKKFINGVITNRIVNKKNNDNIVDLDLSSDDSSSEKVTLKKKKIKYSGLKAKIIKNYKDTSKRSSNLKYTINQNNIKNKVDEIDKKILKLSKFSKDLEKDK